MTRQELIKQGCKLFKTHKNVALLWATGVGKSVASIKMTNTYFKSIKKQGAKVLLVVAEVPHKDNWKKEFKKWGKIDAQVTMECYASLHKYKDTSWDLIIYDEAHHLGTDLRLEILSSIHSDKNILLSATLDRSLLNTLEYCLGYIAYHKVDLQDAISFGILPGPHIHLLPLTLDNLKSDQLITEEWGEENKRVPLYCEMKDRWHYLKHKKQFPNAKLCIRCTALQKYNYLTEQFDYWKKRYTSSRQEFAKNKWLQIGTQRKRFLGEIKTGTVIKLLDSLKDKRFICFCASVAQAELIGKENAIHSKLKNSAEIIKAFNDKKINSLYAVGMLTEGQNLKDIDAGIIVQLDGTERPFIQKFGRTLRANDPHQYIFYYKYTRDQEYLDKVLEGINKDYIDEIDITKLNEIHN